MRPPAYKDPAEATTGLANAFAPSGTATAHQRAAIARAAALVPTTPTPKPPTEPAVLSSTTISDKVIPDNNAKLDTFAKKGTYQGGDGNVYYSDGSMVPAPTDAEFSNGQWQSGGKSYGSAPQYLPDTDTNPDLAKTNEILAGLKSSLDSSTLGTINSIQQQHDILVRNQQDANTRADKSVMRTLLRGGTARNAPLDKSGVVLASTSFGLEKIAKLDADENAAIAAARQAQTEGNYRIMDKALSTIDDIRKTKAAAASKLADTLSKANEDAQTKRMQASRDEAIAGLVAQGVTDPATILEYLNHYEDGSSTDGNFTSDEIAKVLKNIAPETKKGDLYKFTNDDVGKLLGVGLNGDAIQQLSDYYNGHGEAPALSAAQQAIVQKVLTNKTPGAAGDTDFKFTNTQKSQLLSGNFTEEQIGHMQNDVAQYGIDKVLEGVPQDQRALVKRVLAGTDSVADIGASDNTKLTRENVAKLFGITDDSTEADTNGWWWGGKTTGKDQLDSILETIGKYLAVGYTDAEILKLMKDQ